MKTEITRPTWDDVVFESRNREYGAYSIRKSYNENLSKASLIALLFAAFVFGMLQVASLMHVEIKILHPDLPSIPQLPPKIIPEHPIKIKVRTVSPVNRDLTVRIVTHDVDSTQIKLTKATFAVSEPGTGTGVPAGGVDTSNGVVEIPLVVDSPKILVFAELMPEYAGGTNAMLKFLGKNLHYPASARSIGQEGTVYVRFVVNNAVKLLTLKLSKE